MDIKQLEDRVAAAEPNGTLKINIKHGNDGNEGVFACPVTPKDKQVYDSDDVGEFDVFLLNHALVGRPSWGARLRVKNDGSGNRPIIPVEDVLRQIAEAVASGDYPSDEAFEAKGNQ